MGPLICTDGSMKSSVTVRWSQRFAQKLHVKLSCMVKNLPLQVKIKYSTTNERVNNILGFYFNCKNSQRVSSSIQMCSNVNGREMRNQPTLRKKSKEMGLKCNINQSTILNCLMQINHGSHIAKMVYSRKGWRERSTSRNYCKASKLSNN